MVSSSGYNILRVCISTYILNLFSFGLNLLIKISCHKSNSFHVTHVMRTCCINTMQAMQSYEIIVYKWPLYCNTTQYDIKNLQISIHLKNRAHFHLLRMKLIELIFFSIISVIVGFPYPQDVGSGEIVPFEGFLLLLLLLGIF